MAGSRIEQRKKRQIIHRIRRGKQIEVVTVVEAASMRIPSNIAVGLGVIPVAFTVGDSQFSAIAQPMLSLLCGGNNGRTVAGKGQRPRVNEAPLYRFLQEQLLKGLEEEGEGLLLRRRLRLELGQQLVNREFLHRNGLFSLLLWLFHLGFWRMLVGGKVVLVELPEPGKEIVKGSNAGRIAGFKSADDCVGRNKPQLLHPLCNGWMIHCDGQQIGAQ